MKKIFQKNKVFIALFATVVVCAIIVIFVLLKNFFGTTANKYGDRLDGIDNVRITEEKQDDLKNKLTGKDQVENATVNISGKIIYVTLKFTEKASLAEAQSIAVTVLDEFSDEEKKFYDFEFTLLQDKSEKNDGFKIMGAKNTNGANIAWNNNNLKDKDDNKDDKK